MIFRNLIRAALFLMFCHPAIAMDCADASEVDLVGEWESHSYLEKKGYSQSTNVNRAIDGRFTIHFQIATDDGQQFSQTESGRWGYSNCLYSAVIEKIDGEQEKIQEVYYVKSIDAEQMTYESVRSGQTYQVSRVK